MRAEKSAPRPQPSCAGAPPGRDNVDQRVPAGGGAAMRGSEGIRQVLLRTLQQHGLQARLDQRFPLHVWIAAVGSELARRARPTALRAGVLTLLVQDHRWRDQLDAARMLLMERVNERLGRRAVRELRFGLAHEGFLDDGGTLEVARSF